MDNKWSMDAWHPTSREKPQFASDENRQGAFDKLASVTTDLGALPYSGGLWAQRADILAQVGYPELAAGDARKAQKLFATMGNTKVDEFCLEARRQLIAGTSTAMMPMPPGILYNKALWDRTIRQFDFANFKILGKALDQIEAYYSLQEMCKEARALYPKDDIFSSALAGSIEEIRHQRRQFLRDLEPDDADQRSKFGGVLFRQYPFMQTKHLQRSPLLIEGANSRLRRMGAPCSIQASTIGLQCQISAPVTLSKTLIWKSMKHAIGWTPPPQVLGIVATSNIPKGEVIFKDSTPLGSTSMPPVCRINLGMSYVAFRCENCCGITNAWLKIIHQCEKCTTNYCSKYCLEEAKATYHKVICGKDFTWLEPSQKTQKAPVHGYDIDGSMWLRVLAMCVQSGLHPLDHPLIAALTPNYEGPGLKRWSLECHVDVPHKILEALGVDIFKDMRYDTWVLQTIWVRMLNNARGGVHQSLDGPLAMKQINPLYSFINHSCEPNADADNVFGTYPPQTAPVGESTTLAIIATRSIKQGEEIFISYIHDEKLKTRQQRNIELKNWIKGECQCVRCRREA